MLQVKQGTLFLPAKTPVRILNKFLLYGLAALMTEVLVLTKHDNNHLH